MIRFVVVSILLLFVFTSVGISEIETRRDPVVAGICSMVISGGGQAYNGQWSKGIICFSTTVIGWGIALSSLEENPDGELEVTDGQEGGFLIGALIGLGAHVYSIIDAPMTAKKINKRLEQPELSFTPMGLGARMTYRF